MFAIGDAIAMISMIAILTLNGTLQAKATIGLEDVVRANSASVAAIQSLAVRIKEYQTDPMALFGTLKKVAEYECRKQNDEVRITSDNLRIPLSAAGDRLGRSDIYNGPSGLRYVIGVDPSRPPILGEESISKAYGILAPRKVDTNPFPLNMNAALLFEITEAATSRPLRELIATATSARLMASPADSPRGCFELEVKRPETDYRISVDPAANFMIRRVDYAATARNNIQFTSVVEAESFRDCGDGVFLPSKVEISITEDGRTMRIRNEIDVISCNKTIPAEGFRVAFPDWLPVADHRTGKIHYWGPDDAPRLTFNTTEEHRRWWLPRFTKAQYRRPRVIPWSSIIVGTATILVGVVAVVRRKRKRRATTDDSDDGLAVEMGGPR